MRLQFMSRDLSRGLFAFPGRLGTRAFTSLLLIVLIVAVTGCSRDDQSASEAEGETAQAAHLDDATLLEMIQHPDMLMRVEKISAHLQTLGPEDLDATRKIFELAAHDRGDIEYTLFGEWWAGFDAPAAQAWADGAMRGRHPRVISAIVRRWAAQDPEAAVASKRFMKVQVGAPVYRAELLDALIVGWFESEKPGLEDFLQTLVGEDLARGLKTYARIRVIKYGARETLEWTRVGEGFTEPQHRLLTAGALTVVAGQEPQLAAEYLEFANRDGVDTATFVSRIAGGWAELDHEAAVRWLGTLEHSPDRNRGLTRAGGIWARKDPEGLASYLVENSGEKWLDPVRVLAIRRAVNKSRFRLDWTQAMESIDEVVDDRARWSVRAWVLQRWFIVDEAAANAYMLGDSDLPDDFRARARKSSPATRLEVEKALSNSSPLLVN